MTEHFVLKGLCTFLMLNNNVINTPHEARISRTPIRNVDKSLVLLLRLFWYHFYGLSNLPDDSACSGLPPQALPAEVNCPPSPPSTEA
jgi:hypothetical protein